MADRRDPDSMRFLLGVGLDRDDDGHAHITTGEEFLLLGGSKTTHDSMQERVERLEHALRKLGTNIQHATDDEMREAFERAKRG